MLGNTSDKSTQTYPDMVFVLDHIYVCVHTHIDYAIESRQTYPDMVFELDQDLGE
jgi:hypothetical protein